MGETLRHTLVRTEQIGEATVAPADFNELFQRGTRASVTRTGVYIAFPTAYGGTPNVIVAGMGSAANLVGNRIRRGSFQVQLGAAGTARVSWQAWGPRA